MKRIEYVLDFASRLGREMLSCGANMERVILAMEIVCKTYALKQISIHALSNMISLGARDEDDEFFIRQVYVPNSHNHLERLKRLNRLSYEVRKNKPDEKELSTMLDEALNVKDYPVWVVLVAYLFAMTALCRVFGGAWQDMLVAAAHTTGLFFVTRAFAKANLNRIITNVLCMFLCTVSASALTHLGFVQNFYVVVITNVFFLMPGIRMVNAFRNILCGNEMNGILEFLKAILELLTMVVGVAIGVALFPKPKDMILENAIVERVGLMDNVELVLLSFILSFALGVVFEIRGRDLLFAGLGGVLIRIVNIIGLTVTTDFSIGFMVLSAFCAALYAEIVAAIKKTPATVFLYPSVLPLLPGRLICFAIFGVVWGNPVLIAEFAPQGILALVGICTGFVVCSTVTHYIRKIVFKRFFGKKKGLKSQKNQ